MTSKRDQIMPLLIHDAHSALSLSDALNANRCKVITWLKELHRKQRIHITAWAKPERGPCAPIYRAGNMPDTPRPESKPWVRKRVKTKSPRVHQNVVTPVTPVDPLLAIFTRSA
jgi:hypothetical protein